MSRLVRTLDRVSNPIAQPWLGQLARRVPGPLHKWWLPLRAFAPRGLWVDGVEQYTDAGCSTPAIVGDAVYAWRDLSGYGYDAGQGTAAARPIRAADGLNFDGTNHFMTAPSFTSAYVDYTVVAVIDQDPMYGSQHDLFSYNDSSYWCIAASSDALGLHSVSGYDGTAWRAGCVSRTGRQVLTWRWNSAALTLETYRNGVLLGVGVYDGAFRAWVTGAVIGATFTGIQKFDGRLMTLAVFDRVVPDAELGRINSILMAQHGLTFTRNSIASLVFWARPDAANVTLNGSDVAAVADMASTPHNLTQVVALEQPLYLPTGGPNGTPAVEHDGVDETLATVAFTLNQPAHVFEVAKPHVAKDGNYSSSMCGLGSSTSGWIYTIWATSIGIHAGANLGTSGGSDNDQWSRWQFLFNGASSNITKNGVSLVTGDAGANAIGGFVVGTQTGVAGRFFDGAWAERWIYSRQLNAYEIAANDALTLARYGL